MSLMNKVLWQSSYGLTYPEHDDSFELSITGFYSSVITVSVAHPDTDIEKKFNAAIDALEWFDMFLLDKDIECETDYDFILEGWC